MKTSYFAKYREADGISIAAGTPDWFKGPTYPALYPKYWFFKEYKKTGDKIAYIKAYDAEVLRVLDPSQVWEDLKYKTILCWEKPGDFCHRRIIANWLKYHLNVNVMEVTYE